MVKGLITIIAASLAVLLACYSASSTATTIFKLDVHDLLKPIAVPPRDVVDGVLGFVDKMISSTFAFLALALAISIFFLCLEAIASRG